MHGAAQRVAGAGAIALVLALISFLVLGAANPWSADAAKRTVTEGKVCKLEDGRFACDRDRSLHRLKAGKTYGFRGTTKRARSGDRVVFHYKDRSDPIYGEGGGRWIRFDGRAANRGRAVYTPDGRRAIDRTNNRGRWKIRFVPEVTGKYILRATYKGGRGRSDSREKQRTKVAG